RLAVFVGVKFGEVLAYDLFRLESLDPLGPRVPARYEAIGVEQIDGVIDDRLNQQLERITGQGIVHELGHVRQRGDSLHRRKGWATESKTPNFGGGCSDRGVACAECNHRCSLESRLIRIAARFACLKM